MICIKICTNTYINLKISKLVTHKQILCLQIYMYTTNLCSIDSDKSVGSGRHCKSQAFNLWCIIVIMK